MEKASRKARNRRDKKTSSRQPTQWGFDYGLSVPAAALGSIDFNNNLRAADVIGVAYGIGYSIDLTQQVPTISLIARNEEPLGLAFDEFSRWAESSDGDAVDLTFVFLKSGAYKLCISLEPNALINRALRYDAVMSPISIQLYWIKHIDTTSQPLKDLRTHLARGVRPILFGGATYAGIAAPGKPPVPELIRPLKRGMDLLKFHVRFVDEGSDIDEQWQRIAVGPRAGAGKREQRSDPRRVPASVVTNNRVNRLATLFPVTLWRFRRRERFAAMRCAAEASGLLPWQVDQAFCNLIVSREIGGRKPHFEGIQKADWPTILIEHLQGRFEVADGMSEGETQITVDALMRQASLDAQDLLKAYGHNRAEKTLEATQNQLRTRGLLIRLPE